jgi:hypothetical protein
MVIGRKGGNPNDLHLESSILLTSTCVHTNSEEQRDWIHAKGNALHLMPRRLNIRDTYEKECLLGQKTWKKLNSLKISDH